MTDLRAKVMVEPRGVEPLTSTLPVLGFLQGPPFAVATNEEHMRTEQEMKQFSVPSGPKVGNVFVGNFPAPLAYIYFISYQDGPIKIGLSWNVGKRVKQIQTYLPYKIQVLAVARGPVTLEPEYHARFADHRLEGEWFERVPEILAEIDNINAVTPNGMIQLARKEARP